MNKEREKREELRKKDRQEGEKRGMQKDREIREE